MAKTNYSSMRKVEEVKETPVEEVVEEVIEAPVEEVKKPAKKEKKAAAVPTSGKVIGDASLNVRQNPSINANVITTLTPGTEITITEQSDEWYKISIPVSGFVMKRFVEV